MITRLQNNTTGIGRIEHNYQKSGFDLWETEMDGVPKKVREYLEKWHERAHMWDEFGRRICHDGHDTNKLAER